MNERPPTDAELEVLSAAIDSWLNDQNETNPIVGTVERDTHNPRAWFVRILGEQREAYTVYFRLRQRTLSFESYFMPAPEENQAELFRHLLRRNAKMYGASFVVREEDAIYIQGQIDNSLVSLEQLPGELDRVLGSIYQWVEQYFQAALRIGFASRFE